MKRKPAGQGNGKERMIRMQRFRALWVIGIFILLAGCGELFEPDPPDPGPVVSLDVGTEYYFHHVEDSDTTFRHIAIIGDTLIDDKTYAVFDNGHLKRVKDGVVYIKEGGDEIIEMNFRVAIGDSVRFNGTRMLVRNVQRKAVFGFSQSVITVESDGRSPDIHERGIYSTLYGTLSHVRIMSSGAVRDSLTGAVVSGKPYGEIPE